GRSGSAGRSSRSSVTAMPGPRRSCGWTAAAATTCCGAGRTEAVARARARLRARARTRTRKRTRKRKRGCLPRRRDAQRPALAVDRDGLAETECGEAAHLRPRVADHETDHPLWIQVRVRQLLDPIDGHGLYDLLALPDVVGREAVRAHVAEHPDLVGQRLERHRVALDQEVLRRLEVLCGAL